MKEFNELLKELGISRREFADQIGVTYESMGAMLVESKPVPKWAKSALIVAKALKKNSNARLREEIERMLDQL
jgi:DNA-binding XRE family transcriptional regulator